LSVHFFDWPLWLMLQWSELSSQSVSILVTRELSTPVCRRWRTERTGCLSLVDGWCRTWSQAVGLWRLRSRPWRSGWLYWSP